MGKHTKTLKVRVKDRHAPALRAMAREVNFVWNYVNELSERLIRERRMFPSGYDLAPYRVAVEPAGSGARAAAGRGASRA